MKGYDYVEVVLKNKLNMTDAEITTGFNSGKTMYDLAKEKGMTEDEFKEALLEERNKAIDHEKIKVHMPNISLIFIYFLYIIFIRKTCWWRS